LLKNEEEELTCAVARKKKGVVVALSYWEGPLKRTPNLGGVKNPGLMKKEKKIEPFCYPEKGGGGKTNTPRRGCQDTERGPSRLNLNEGRGKKVFLDLK